MSSASEDGRVPASGSRERRQGGVRGPERVDRLLGRVLDRTGIRTQLERVEALSRWDEVVGERIAGVTRAKSVSGATLFVEVRSSAWLMELNTMKQEILKRLNAGRDQGRIEKLILVLAEDPDDDRVTGPGRRTGGPQP